VCGRPDVGMGNIRVSDTSRRHHNADTLAPGWWGLVQSIATRLAHTRGALAEYTEVEVPRRGERTYYPYC
jgi:hypothetical protein